MNKRPFYNLTFQQRLVLGISGLLFITTFALGIAGNEIAKNFLFKRFKDRMEFLAKYLAANSELGILLNDTDMLMRLSKNLLSEKDVVQVKIFDIKGKILASSKAQNADIKGARIASSKVFLTTTSENEAYGTGQFKNKELGRVEIFYVTTSINELTNKLRFSYAFLTLFIAGVGVIFFLFFTKKLTSPLASLLEAAHEVAQGNLDVKLHEGQLPETRKLAKSFNTMTKALKESRKNLEETYQKLIQEKSLSEVGRFAITVAHEVKNPLGIIKGALDILKKNEIDQDTRETMISYVEDEIERLNSLITDFLDFSRPQNLKFTPVDLKGLLSDIVERLKVEWQPKGIDIVFDSNVNKALLDADKAALWRALLNIIKNSCEVSKKGQQIQIELKHKYEEIVITIKDEGPGIKDTDKKRIFEPFFTKKSKGTGLGLTLAKKIIDAHMGYIEVLDNKPKGTVIKIFFKS